jgi:hypothetical protein
LCYQPVALPDFTGQEQTDRQTFGLQLPNYFVLPASALQLFLDNPEGRLAVAQPPSGFNKTFCTCQLEALGTANCDRVMEGVALHVGDKKC